MPEVKPNVTISLAGLTLFCINDKQQLEVAVLQCPQHELLFDIQEITFDEATGERISSNLLITDKLDLKRNITIEVDNPGYSGITQCLKGEFNRERDLGDSRDFRWVIDLEGDKFGKKKLRRVFPGSVAHPKLLSPIITITYGELYTEKKSDEKFAVISLDCERRPQLLGSIAYRVGLDMTLKEDDCAAVLVSNGGADNLLPPLTAKPGKRYLITIENLCPLSEEMKDGTDFRFIFDALRNENGERFDLQRVVENRGHGGVMDVLPGHPDFSLDSEIQTCNGGYLGQTGGFSSSNN